MTSHTCLAYNHSKDLLFQIQTCNDISFFLIFHKAQYMFLCFIKNTSHLLSNGKVAVLPFKIRTNINMFRADLLFLKASTKLCIDLKDARSHFIHRISSFFVFVFSSPAVVSPSFSLRQARITLAPGKVNHKVNTLMQHTMILTSVKIENFHM